jgi:hypothetical protein
MVGGPSKGEEKLIVCTEFSISRLLNLIGDVGSFMSGIGSCSCFTDEFGFSELGDFFISFLGGDEDRKESNFSEVVFP